MAKRLRVGRHHGVTIVEHDGDEDRGRLVAVVAMADVDGQAPSMLAAEIVAAVNAARDQRDSRSVPGRIPGAARQAGEGQR